MVRYSAYSNAIGQRMRKFNINFPNYPNISVINIGVMF